MEYAKILEKARRGEALDAKEAGAVVARLPRSLLEIMGTASLVRETGESAPFTCGIINAKSGRCPEDCRFCAQSAAYPAATPVHPLVPEEDLLRRARFLAETGADYMGIVCSGVGPTPKDFERILNAARRITRDIGIRLCASIGVLSLEQTRRMKEAGFTSVHHNLESARSFFPSVCSTHDYDARLETARNAKAAGLRLCCCGIFGLGESWEQRLELSETIRELDVDSIPLNFLNPIPGTPLADRRMLSASEALGIIAVMRLMHPRRDILICSGRTTVLAGWENAIFFAGANGFMLGDYLTLRGNPLEKDLGILRTLGLRAG
ncbi:MAG: biotin synthase BioB [Desulfovibrio sp.]|nr:biotin synthase BioB [Desulfovibrio sp.]